jgi:WD40 repeat protein
MLRSTVVIILVAAALSLAGCQPGSPGSFDPTQAEPASRPTETPRAALATPPATRESSSTPTITSEPNSTPAELPTATTVDGPCFTVREAIPFTFTPDGKGIALRSMTGVQIVDLETMEEELFIEAPGNLYTAALSPDGETLAWSLEDNSIQLVRLADQTVVHTLAGHTDIVFKLRFSPSGDRLYSASHDSWVRAWDMQGNLVQSIQPGFGEVLGIGISPDGNMLAAIPFDGPVVLWDLVKDQKQADLISGTGGYDTSDAAFSPDGQYVAADLATGLFIWRVSDGELAWEEHPHTMTGTFSPDGRYLAYADIDQGNRVFLLSPDDFQQLTSLEMDPTGAVWELFFSPDGTRLAATDGIEVRIWDVGEGAMLSVGKVECP